jgi:hypothetical protein
MAPLANPIKGKSKNRKWILYAAGAGILLALIFLLRKGTPAAETAPASTLTAAEPAASGAGGGGEGLTPVTNSVPPPSLNLGPVNPGESVSASEATSGGEVSVSREREAADAGATPEQVKAAEAAAVSAATAKAHTATLEGQYKKAEAEKAKLKAQKKAPAASHSSKGHPASKPRHGHSPAKHAKAPAKRSRAHHHASKPAHHAAPTHKTAKKRR